MAEEIVMPRLSDTMERGTIARWLVHEGDAVHEGDVLAEIETDKATMELERLRRRRAAAHPRAGRRGRRARRADRGGRRRGRGCLGLLGRRGDGDGCRGRRSGGGRPRREPARPAPRAARRGRRRAEPPRRPRRQPAGELKASPVARRIASDAGFDLRALAGKGSGPDGRIVRVDVERAMAGGAARQAPRRLPPPPLRQPRLRRPRARGAAAEADTVIEPSPMLRAVARRMSESKSQVPHFYLQCEIDMGKALALREELNAELADEGVKLTVNDLIVRACALALRDHPQFHRSWVDGKLYQHGAAHVGVAVALDEGLIVPVIRNADSLPLRELAVGRARSRGARPLRLAAASTRSRAARSASPTSACSASRASRRSSTRPSRASSRSAASSSARSASAARSSCGR